MALKQNTQSLGDFSQGLSERERTAHVLVFCIDTMSNTCTIYAKMFGKGKPPKQPVAIHRAYDKPSVFLAKTAVKLDEKWGKKC
jgi:hypothetical protein